MFVVPSSCLCITDRSSHSGVATGWTGVDMSTPLLLEVAPEIDTNPTGFLQGEGRGSVRSAPSPRSPCLSTPHILTWRRPCPFSMLPLVSRINFLLLSVDHALMSAILIHLFVWLAQLPSVPSTHHSHHPSPSHPFTPDLRRSFSANPSHHSLPFLLQNWLHGFPGLFTATSEHISFLLFIFFNFFYIFLVFGFVQ